MSESQIMYTDNAGNNWPVEELPILITDLVSALERVLGWYGLSDVQHLMSLRGESSDYNKTVRNARAALRKAREYISEDDEGYAGPDVSDY